MSKGKQPEKIKAHYNTEHYYKYYINSNCSDKNSKFYVTKKVYVKVLKEFFDLIIEDMIMTGEPFILPYNMGKLQIKKYKVEVKLDENGNLVNKLPIDFHKTKLLRESNPEAAEKKIIIRHLNKHSDGYVFRFFYIKHRAKYKNRILYKFKITRTNKEKLARAIRKYGKKIDFLKVH